MNSVRKIIDPYVLIICKYVDLKVHSFKMKIINYLKWVHLQKLFQPHKSWEHQNQRNSWNPLFQVKISLLTDSRKILNLDFRGSEKLFKSEQCDGCACNKWLFLFCNIQVCSPENISYWVSIDSRDFKPFHSIEQYWVSNPQYRVLWFFVVF